MVDQPEKTILLVEDDSVTRFSMSLWLRKAGCRVLQREDGEEALAYMKRLGGSPPVDLILLDIQMPRLNGLDFIRELRRLQLGTPVIIVTSHRRKDIDLDLAGWGVRDFLEKPVRPDELLRAVARGLGKGGDGQF